MIGTWLFRESRLRRAFSRWYSGEAQTLPPGDEPGQRWARGLALAEAGDGEAALELLSSAPQAPSAFRAVALLWSGRPGQAADLCQAEGRNPLQIALLGQALLECGDRRGAAAAWRRQGPSPWRLVSARALGALLLEAHRSQPEALSARLATDLREERPPRPPWPLRLFRSGLDFLEGLGPRIRRDRATMERIRILSLAERGELGPAIARAGSLRRELGEEAWPRALLVELLGRQGDDRRIVELCSGRHELAGPLSLALARLGRWEESLAALRLLEQPEAPHLFAAGCAHARAGRLHEAARAFLGLRARDELALVDLLERETRLFLAREGDSG